MTIKCTERTETHNRYLHNVMYLYKVSTTPNTYDRVGQQRKRSLTSMGWRYHL